MKMCNLSYALVGGGIQILTAPVPVMWHVFFMELVNKFAHLLRGTLAPRALITLASVLVLVLVLVLVRVFD